MKTTSEIAAALHSKDDSERSHALQIAGDLLREAAPDFMRTPSAEQLKQAIFDALQQETDPSRACDLIWVLGKSSDRRYRSVYREYLQKFAGDLLAANEAVFQCLIALDNCREPVFERDAQGRGSQSILEIEKNLRQARAYLAKHEVKVPETKNE